MNKPETDITPSIVKVHDLLGRNMIPEAVEMAQSLTRENPGDPAGWAVFTSILLTANELAGALVTIKRALALQPDCAAWQVLAARVFVMAGDLDRGKSALQKAITLNAGNDAGVLCDAGYVCTLLRDHAGANELFTEATQRQPGMAMAHYNLGMNEIYLGNFEAAEAALNRAIEFDQAPFQCKFEAMLSRADLRKQSTEQNHVEELKAELGNQLPPKREAVVCYALAKELEDLEQYGESFRFRKRGADLRNGTFRYDVNVDVAAFDEIIETHHQEALAALPPGTDDASPIFVVGLPRSGTTLADRIISSHSDVTSAGELRSFANELVRLCQSRNPGPDIMATALHIDMQELGDAYVHNMRQRIPGSPRFVDKLPMNYHYCGLISRALPQSKIVHLKREPMDACYAIYKALFRDAYPFSYDLDTLATYYIGYRRLMAHWDQTLGDHVLHVHYEKLVSDFELESRRIFDFLGLGWQPGVLDFHQQGSAATTASAIQVRSPVSRDSVGKWKNYEVQLAPLRARLEKAGMCGW